MLLGFACLAAWADPVERKTVTIPRATGPITVDGDLADWGDLPPAPANPDDVTIKPATAVIILDPDEPDFRGQVWLRWTPETLYAAFRIMDSSPMRNAGDDPFLAFKSGDTVELFLCTNPNADPNRAEPEPGDYRIILTNLHDTTPIVFAYHPIGKGEPKYVTHPTGGWGTRMDESGLIPDAKFAFQLLPTKDGYTAEVSIPWKFFPGFTPQAGLRLPFNWALNFSDAAGQKNVMKLWWNGPNTMCTDIPTEMRLNTSTWGWAVLGN
jgi:hypothetical protein